MATFLVSTPDGAKYQISAPEGASEQDAINYAQGVHATPSAAPAQPSVDASLPQTLQLGVPYTGLRFDTGIKLPPSLGAALVSAGHSASQLVNGVRQILPGSNAAVDADEAAGNAAMKPVEQAHPAAAMAGSILPYAVTGNPALMAAESALSYGTPTQRLENAAFAYGGGKVGQGVARLFGPASMAAKPVGDTASSFFEYPTTGANPWGIPLRMAQITDSRPIKIIDAVAGDLPASSGTIYAAKDASYGAFNRAVSNTFGADSSKITPQLLGDYKASIGSTIGNLADRNDITASPVFTKSLDQLRADANEKLVGTNQDLVNKWIDNVEARIQPRVNPDGSITGFIPGNTYKALRSDIGAAAAGNPGTTAHLLGNLRSSLTNAMTDSVSPEDAEAWARANQQYFNLKQVANAAASMSKAAGAPKDALSISKLLQSVNSSQPNARFGLGNDLAQLAQFGKRYLPDEIPNSGTTPRMFYQQLLTSPITTLGAGLGGWYGLKEVGVSPEDALLGLLTAYGAARGVAGRPASALTRNLLTRGGGLLGVASGAAAPQ